MRGRTIYGIVIAGLMSAAAFAAPASPLADAVEKGNKAEIQRLLQSGADANAPQADGTSALHWAAFRDDLDTAALLVKAGAKPDQPNLFGAVPLAQACENGSAAMVKLLLDAGAKAGHTLKGGETVLMLASRSGNAEIVKMLLARGADANARERLGQTALMWAAAEGHTAVIRALLDAGADRNAKIEVGFTPFLFAVREGHLDAVREFLRAGEDVNAMMRRAGDDRPARLAAGARTSPLMLAVQNGHFELAIALIDAGANPNDLRTGFTPLHILPGVRKPDSSDGSDGAAPDGAGRLSSLDFVREIVKRGADVNLRLPAGTPRVPQTSSTIGSAGATPLLFAADRSDLPLMRLLLELAADPLLPNSTGTTPLMAAAGVGTRETQEEAGEEGEAVEAVSMLIDRGASVNTVDELGDTAMHGASAAHYPRVVNLLAERGADPKIWSKPNRAGRTPLFIAEGYVGAELRPDVPTIEAVKKLMISAGLSLDGKRPEIIDQYAPQPTGRAAAPAK